MPHPIHFGEDTVNEDRVNDDYVLECLKCHFKCGPKGEETHLRDSISSDMPSNLETALKKE